MLQNNQDLINMFISAASGLLVAALAAWIAIKKVFNFEKLSKERDAKNDEFKKEVDNKMGAQNKKIELLHEEITNVKTSTILHIDKGFEAQDKKNADIFPSAKEVFPRLEKLDIARETMFKMVMVEQRNLSEKQDEIFVSVREIFKRIDEKQNQELSDLKQELRDLKHDK